MTGKEIALTTAIMCLMALTPAMLDIVFTQYGSTQAFICHHVPLGGCK